MTPEDRVAAVADRHDPDGDLALGALQRLEWRRARSGKVCARCRDRQPLSEFGTDPTRDDGLAHRCRSCERERKRAARRDARSDV